MSVPPLWGEGFRLEKAVMGRDMLIVDEFQGDQLCRQIWKAPGANTNVAFADDSAAGAYGCAQVTAGGGGSFALNSNGMALGAGVDWSLYVRCRSQNYAGWGGGNDNVLMVLDGFANGQAGFEFLYDGAHHNIKVNYNFAVVADLGVAVPGTTHSDLIVRRANGRTYWGVNGTWLYDQADTNTYVGGALVIANGLASGLNVYLDTVKFWAARSGSAW